MTKWDFSLLCCFNIQKSIHVIQHINRLKKKNHMIISKDAEKTFDKIQHPFMIKTVSRKLEVFLLRSGTTERCPFLPLIFNIVLKDLANIIKH